MSEIEKQTTGLQSTASGDVLVDFLVPQFEDRRVLATIRSIAGHPESGRFRIIILDGGRDEALQADIRAALRPFDIHRIAPDRGVFDAINIGLELATAPWIGWMGADDMLAATFSTQPLATAKDDMAFVSYVALLFRSDSPTVTRVYTPARSRSLRMAGFHLPHFSTFIRTPVARKIKFRIELKNFADQLYMYELETRHRGVTSPLVSTIVCEGGISNSSRSTILKTNRQIIHEMRPLKGLFGAVVYVGMKIAYKLEHRTSALLRERSIVDYLKPGESPVQ